MPELDFKIPIDVEGIFAWITIGTLGVFLPHMPSMLKVVITIIN